jgi:hypothetical protein
MTTTEKNTPAARTAHTIEWAPFRLAEGVDETRLLAASDVLQREFVSQQPGFIRRELLKGQGDQWVDIIYWESRTAAEEASRNAMNSPICHTYFALMVGVDNDDPAAGVSHFEQVQIYA